MAMPLASAVNTAVSNLYQVFKSFPLKRDSRAAIHKLEQLYRYVVKSYAPDITLTVTNAADASLTAFLSATGSLGVALGAQLGTARQAPIGLIFKVTGTGDTTGTGLTTAKGGAPAANDIFVVTSTTAVVYLGASTTLDLSTYKNSDFVS
jgi:hypothetical protein